MARVTVNSKKHPFLSLQTAEMFLSAFVFGLAALLIFYTSLHSGSNFPVRCIKTETVTNGRRLTPTLQPRCVLSLQEASTEPTREQGLSGRVAMPLDRGMLFIFDGIGRQCMWMKDMNFALDMAWLDSQGRVLKVVENLSPDTYPQEFCADGTLFVIEVNAGAAKPNGIVPGAQFNL